LVLTAVCVAGLLAAAAMVVRWGRQERPASGPAETPLELARTAVVGVLGGAAAGVLVAGLGGRLVMRVLAATSGDAAQGLLTEADERVGRITYNGTMGLVVFVGLFGGIAGGLAYVAVRRWLPRRTWKAGLVLGVLLLGLARLDPLKPDNKDFALLHPTWLAVVLVVALFPAFGVAAAALIERIDRSWTHRPVGLIPLVLIAPSGPFALGAVVIAGAAYAAKRAGWRPPPRAGQVAVAVAGAGGLVSVSTAAVAILT
jgi:hypothetical protein